MALVCSYKDLRKEDGNNSFLNFEPLRAIGLALEQGFRQARQKGLNKLTADDLTEVKVSGTLQVREGGRWRNTDAATLRLLPRDAAFSLELLHSLRGRLTDIGFNYDAIDYNMGGVFWDLLGDFTHNRYNTPGPGRC